MALLDRQKYMDSLKSLLERKLNYKYSKYRFSIHEVELITTHDRTLYVHISSIRWFQVTITESFLTDYMMLDTPENVLFDLVFEECCRLAEHHIDIIEAPQLILGSLTSKTVFQYMMWN